MREEEKREWRHVIDVMDWEEDACVADSTDRQREWAIGHASIGVGRHKKQALREFVNFEWGFKT